MGNLSRRDFLKYTGGSLAAVAVGTQMPWLAKNPVFSASTVQSLEFHITDAMKEMVTHNAINDARCYFWIYKFTRPDLDADCPGPIIFTTVGDEIDVRITNDLDEPHSFFIAGMVDTGPIAPGRTVVGTFKPSKAGAFLYYDNLNSPVNRMMGLHGALIVMPRSAASGHKFTPYDSPTPAVQKLFDDFGSSAHFPGLAWEQGDPATNTPPFRTYVWLAHQASPNLFREVGELPAGQIYSAEQFVNSFLWDPFSPTNANRTAQYFTINGQSGHFSHNNPHICPNLRVGEPCVVHILNAGLWTHSMHVHANHFFVTSENGVVDEYPYWIDVYNVHPMDTVDYVLPFMRPPDVPNTRGIGLPDTPMTSRKGQPVWPPLEEIGYFIPPVGTKAGNTPIHVQLSPLCYPMHDHSEPSQTAQGGNYNLGLISGINFTGDRNLSGGVMTFPNAPTVFPPNTTGVPAPDMDDTATSTNGVAAQGHSH